MRRISIEGRVLELGSRAGKKELEEEWEALRRLTNIVSPAGTFGYTLGGANPAGSLITKLSLPNGAVITNGYDSLARLLWTALNNSSGQTLDAYGYQYDALGLRTNITRNLGLAVSTVSANYDAIGQLTGWMAKETNTVRWNEQLGFSYDAADNLRTRTNGMLLQIFAVDPANELTNVARSGTLTVAGNTLAGATSVTVNGQAAPAYGDLTFAGTNNTLVNGNNSFSVIAQNGSGLKTTNTTTSYLPTSDSLLYDNNGNLTNDGLKSLSYDDENQLSSVMVPGQWRAAYVYDGLGRRRITQDYAWEQGHWVETNEVRYVYDGMLPVQERDRNNNPLVTYTRGIDLGGDVWSAGGIGGLLARTDGSGSTFYHADGVGNITALMNGSQNIVARYLYNPFGKLVGEWGGMADANKYRFSSKEWDPLSGMYYYGFRFYDPNLQRWLNRDPIGEEGGINLYTFVFNDSQGWIELYGECPTAATSAGSFAGAGAGESLGTGVAAGLGRSAIGVAEAVPEAIAASPAGLIVFGPFILGPVNPYETNPAGINAPPTYLPFPIAQQSYRPNSKPTDAPPRTLPINSDPRTKDKVHPIKNGLRGDGVGPDSWVGISPDGDVIVTKPDGRAENLGPYDDYCH